MTATDPARLSVDPAQTVGEIRRRLFGSFVEHLGRGVYTGVFEPDHPSADDRGFRKDVLDLVRELGVTTIRYPGGNFVSSYRWEDGVGPRDTRPARLDLAWHSLEPNLFGTDEFIQWCRTAGVEPMMAVNAGTRGTEEAVDLLEYCNHPGGTSLSDARRSQGAETPHDIRLWCLGNEMDGPWQIGYTTADAYGRQAADMARAMRRFDPRLELVVCGSSGRSMPTFGSWEKTVLEHAYEEIDYISAHAYYEETDGDLASFLASATDLEAFIDGVVQAADTVRAAKHSPKRVDVSFDEWNVWYLSKVTPPQSDDWPTAPRLLEDIYTVADAVAVGDLLIALVRHADRVAAASLAQLVNVIAPIMTEPGGRAWRQTTFHPFALTARHAQPLVLASPVSGPTLATAKHGDVGAVDAVATWDGGKQASIFAVNRDPANPHRFEVDLTGLGRVASATGTRVHDPDVSAVNTLENPDRVTPREAAIAVDGSRLSVDLPAVSWTMLRARLD